MGDEAAQAHRVDRLVDVPPASDVSWAVRSAVPDGASSLRSWWSSAISHSGLCGAIRLAVSMRSTAPMAKLRRHGQIGVTDALELGIVRAVVPLTQWTPASRHIRALCSAVAGTVKSTTTSASPSTSSSATPSSGFARPTRSMSSAPSTAAQTVAPHAPRSAGDRDVDGHPRGELGLRGASAARNASASAPTPAAERRSGRTGRGTRRRGRRPRRH